MNDTLFPPLLHFSIAIALLAGGSRTLWLFLSPVPSSAAVIQRPRLVTIGRFAPLLVLVGCAAIAGLVGFAQWLKSVPHGWWNIVPILLVYALGMVGAIAVLGGILVQSILVDANRGFDLEADTGNLQRNLDAACVLAFGIIALTAMGFHWLPELNWSTATLADIERRESVIRVPLYVAVLAAIIQTYYAVRAGTSETGKGPTYLTSWVGATLFIALDWIIKAILPRDYEIERYLRDRGDPISVLGVETPLAPPPGLLQGEVLATVGLSLMVMMSVTTLVDMIARRGVSSIYIPQRSWPGIVFACLALSSTALFARHDLPQDISFDWIGEVAVPLAIGMTLVRAFPVLWAFGARGWRYATKTAAHGLLAQTLLLLLLAPLAAALLYVASWLSTTGFAVLLLGGIAAAALGWLRLPAATATSDAAPISTP